MTIEGATEANDRNSPNIIDCLKELNKLYNAKI